MSTAFRNICRFLVVLMMLSPVAQVQAGMLTTEQAVSAQQGESQRAMLLATVSRSEVANQLSSLGVDPSTARERVAAMSDDEVRTLNGQIQSMPAGGMADGWWWAIGIVVVAAIIWYAYGYK